MAYGAPPKVAWTPSPQSCAQTVLLLAQPEVWIPRIEERLEFVDMWSIRRTTTLDVSLPSWLGTSAPQDQDSVSAPQSGSDAEDEGQYLLPIALFPRSHHLTSLTIRTDEQDPAPRFVFDEERRVMFEGLSALFLDLHAKRLFCPEGWSETGMKGLIWDRLTQMEDLAGGYRRLDEWIEAKGEAQLTELHLALLGIWREKVTASPAVVTAVQLLDRLGVSYPVLTLCPRRRRQVVVYETLERRNEFRVGVLSRFQPKDTLIFELFDVPKFCTSYHITATAPKDMFLESLEVRAEPSGGTVTSDTLQPQVVREADSQNLGQFAHVRIAANSRAGQDPGGFFGFQAVAVLRNRPTGVLRMAPFVNALALVGCFAMAVLAGPHKSWADPGLSAALLAMPGVLATLLALPTDHQIPIWAE